MLAGFSPILDWTLFITGWFGGPPAVGYCILWAFRRAKTHHAWRANMTHTQQEQTEILRLVKCELSANGGQSVKDLVVATAIEVKYLAKNDVFTTALAHEIGNTILTFTTDASGGATKTSQGYRTLVGATREQLMGWSWQDLIPPADRIIVVDAWKSIVADKRDATFQVVLQPLDGRPAVRVTVKAKAQFLRTEFIGHFAVMTAIRGATLT